MEGNQKLLPQFEPNRYPIAEPFFGSKSLEKTWPRLETKKEKQKHFNRKSLSKMQRWILELKELNGECRILTLMNFAINQGLTPGEFYQEFEQELKGELIKEAPNGSVDLK
jgi:hypothetical protein